MKYKLLGSAPTLDRLKELLSNYFYTDIKLSVNPANNGQWQVSNSKGIIPGCRVIIKSNRYRFEMVPMPESTK